MRKVVFALIVLLLFFLHSVANADALSENQKKFLSLIQNAALIHKKNLSSLFPKRFEPKPPDQTLKNVSSANERELANEGEIEKLAQVLHREIAFLPNPEGIDMPDLAEAVTKDLKSLGTNQPWLVHHPFFSDYAKILLDLVYQFSTVSNQAQLFGVTNEEIWNAVSRNNRKTKDFASALLEAKRRLQRYPEDKIYRKFQNEILKRETTRTANYEWLVLFADRLSFFADPLAAGGVVYFNRLNTRDQEYKYTLAVQAHFTNQPEYSEAVQNVGDTFTKKISSPLALTRLFPQIVMLPYPFQLSVEDLLFHFPSKVKNFWALGFSLGDVFADNLNHRSYQFYTHDYQHLAVLRAACSSLGITLPNNKNPDLRRLRGWLGEGSELFLDSISVLSNRIRTMPPGSEERRVFGAILYYLAHEGLSHLYERLDGLWSGYLQNPMISRLRTDFWYTRENYPSSMFGEYFSEAVIDYMDRFNDFVLKSLNQTQSEKISTWLSFVRPFQDSNNVFQPKLEKNEYIHPKEQMTFLFPLFHNYGVLWEPQPSGLQPSGMQKFPKIRLETLNLSLKQGEFNRLNGKEGENTVRIYTFLDFMMPQESHGNVSNEGYLEELLELN